MRACQHRQAYLQLAAERYKVSLQPVALLEFANALVAGRQVTLDVPNATIKLDPTLFGLILDNALSNAFKHGHPVVPNVQLTIECYPVPIPSMVSVKFMVSNAVNPSRPAVTQDYVKKVLSGEAWQEAPRSAMSDRIGLQHSFLAAQAHGMSPCLRQHEGRVLLELELTAEVVDRQQVAADAQRDADLAAYPTSTASTTPRPHSVFCSTI
jgi:hypothetical protein